MSWAGLYCVLAGTCEGGVDDENWRISDAARCMNYWDGTTGDAFHCFDDTAMEVDFPVLRLFVKWTAREGMN